MAFVQVTVNEKDNKYESSLYTVPAAGGTAPVRITGGTRDTTPRWSPDGKWIAFVRPNDKETPQIFLLPMRGGEARALTDLPKGAGGPVWSPDGKTIAFTSTTVADDMKKPDPAAKPERKSDVKVVTRAVYRANGNPTLRRRRPPRPHLDGRRSTRRVTRPRRRRSQRRVRRARRAVVARRRDDLFRVGSRRRVRTTTTETAISIASPAAGGEITKVASIDGTIGSVAVSPDGKKLAFVGTLSGQPVRSYSQPDLWVVDATPGSRAEEPDRVLRLRHRRRASAATSPRRAAKIRGRSSGRKDGAVADRRDRGEGELQSEAGRVASGKMDAVTTGEHDIAAYHGGEGRRHDRRDDLDARPISATSRLKTADGPAKPPCEDHARQRRLFAEIAQSEPEEIWYTSFDGRKIQALDPSSRPTSTRRRSIR